MSNWCIKTEDAVTGEHQYIGFSQQPLDTDKMKHRYFDAELCPNCNEFGQYYYPLPNGGLMTYSGNRPGKVHWARYCPYCHVHYCIVFVRKETLS